MRIASEVPWWQSDANLYGSSASCVLPNVTASIAISRLAARPASAGNITIYISFDPWNATIYKLRASEGHTQTA